MHQRRPSDDELAMIGGATQTIDARNEILPGIVVVPTRLGTSGVSLREQQRAPLLLSSCRW